MNPPLFVLQHNTAARELLDKQAVKEPSFSRGTYQVEVLDRKTAYFPFLQMDDEGTLLDSFCSCKLSEKSEGCPHLAAAYLRLVNKSSEPLHIRFRKSLFNRLFQMASKRHGYDPSILKKEGENTYVIESKTKKRLFSITATEAALKRLELILLERVEETEETSIKFFNLPAEDLALWRQGKASYMLRYELSFWSDLAKWFFWKADSNELYEIAFQGELEQIPHEISIAFEGLSLVYYISDVNWAWIIPALSTVRSPLQVFEQEGNLPKVHYDPLSKTLAMQHAPEMPLQEPREGIPIGEWIYVAGSGFYKKTSEAMIGAEGIQEGKIGSFLTHFAKTLQERLDVPLHGDPRHANYRLFFDAESQLHIELYVFEPQDLSRKEAALFLPWAYLPDSGFWRLEEVLFEEKEKIVPKANVSEFIVRHRHWLHQFPGFQTHFGSLEAHLTCSFTAEGHLTFNAEIDYPEQFEEAIDFDEWVYLKGQGFYMKKQNRGRMPLHPGLVVPQEEIGTFLANHKEDLEQVQGFFASGAFIEKSGLAIRVNEQGLISIEPKREFAAAIDPAQCRFYGDYIYVEGAGFSELPPSSRLPERYRATVVIPASQEAAFLVYELDPLRAFTIEIDPRLVRPELLELQFRKIMRDKRSRTTQWLIDASYTSSMGAVDLFQIWDAMQAKKSYLFSSAGLISLKDPRFQWIRQIPKRHLDRKRALVKINTLEWIRLTVFEQIKPPLGDDPDARETRKLLEEISRFESHRLLDLSRLQSTLRPYQELGVQWLWFLYCHGLSGLLCDDMGLGKTHQTMALLAAISHEDESLSNKYLVVCPTSVIYHWQELLQRFLPHLRVCTYYGLARSLDDFSAEYDLLLTSYGILRTGREDLHEFHFEAAVFDEIQIAKNQASQTHQALKAISCRMRLGLTGTPIENRLREIKALFDLVLPGYLPADAIFRDLFINPIEKFQDPEKKELLSKLVKPFILRRKKSEVLTDLPEKIEEISYCDLSSEQKELYRSVAFKMRESVYMELKDKERPISYVHVFSALSTLKQICDHPSLYLDDPKSYASHASGKWDLFVELLSEAQGSGQKVVVFSQYLGMLAIIEAHLRKKGIGFASIKGSTRDRNEQLRRFREDPDCEVFAASLLAAGVGIDLTVASVVIHYDRWWNPAKENQATDRVHRIGQSRGVQVFKLVAKNTIEEHIHAMIEKKKGLLEDLVGQDDGDRINYLNREELLAIFEKIWSEEGFTGAV